MRSANRSLYRVLPVCGYQFVVIYPPPVFFLYPNIFLSIFCTNFNNRSSHLDVIVHDWHSSVTLWCFYTLHFGTSCLFYQLHKCSFTASTFLPTIFRLSAYPITWHDLFKMVVSVLIPVPLSKVRLNRIGVRPSPCLSPFSVGIFFCELV